MSDDKEYIKRRKSLIKDLESGSQSKVTRELLIIAIAHTDACHEIYSEVHKSLTPFNKTMREKLNNIESQNIPINRLKKDVERLEDLVDDDDERDKLYEVLLPAIEFLENGKDFPIRYIEQITDMYLEAIRKLDVILNNSIYPESNAPFIKDAMEEVSNVLLGLIPFVGDGIGAMFGIKNITQARKNRATSADRYMRMLEDYITATELWCLVAQMVILLLEAVDRQSSLDPNVIQSRCEKCIAYNIQKVRKEIA